MIIGIIGAGAAGMAAALAAAENENNQVILLERQARVGRKLLATGNGRCNLTNLHASSGGYHGNDPAFSAGAIAAFGPEQTIQWFRGLGLLTVVEESGRVYPYSDQANSVVDVLRLGLEKENITLKTGIEIQKIRKEAEGFSLFSEEEKIFCHKLIVACGGLAGTKLGGSMAGYKLLAKLGHKSTRLRPALVQLKCGWDGIVSLKGVRAHCYVQILRDGVLHRQSTGELQFTDYGLSGPVIFETSRDACTDNGQWTAKLDLLPQLSREQLLEELQRRRGTYLPVGELLTGILHNRLGRTLTLFAGIRGNGLVRELTDEQMQAVCRCVKELELKLQSRWVWIAPR